MTRYFIAVTFEVCEHNNIYEDMNEYRFESSADIDKQIKEFAKIDVAPIVKVYESHTSNFEDLRFYREYKFIEYECGCNHQSL